MIEALDSENGGFRCCYTGMLLILDDPDSPWYLSFDHIDPRKSRLAVCARQINEMKQDLTGEEFRTVVLALSDYMVKGLPLDPGVIDFVCWPGRFEMPAPASLGRSPPSPKGCKVCRMTRRPYSIYCNRCRSFIYRKPEHVARSEAMIEGWDAARQGFVCKYSGVLLDHLNRKSPWFMTFDHRFPGKKGFLVVCAAWINYLKSDLTDEQFRKMLKMLADRFRDGAPFDRDALGL
ncbi:MAG: hypothetical protein FJ149_11070 [Euryarchaeota archaeon]|nr:hypothetical protein [Euryarchaeota archaeon]